MDSCGTRTELCYSCNRFIQMKDQEEHFASNCKYPIVVEKPKISEINNPFYEFRHETCDRNIEDIGINFNIVN
jgi:hypothetical protein